MPFTVTSELLQSFDAIVIISAVLWLIFALAFIFPSPETETHSSRNRSAGHKIENGSVYLKVGALVFAVGGVIFCSLEIANFVENPLCLNAIVVVNASLSITLILGQLYLIFTKSTVGSRLAKTTTNLICTWFIAA